MGARNRLLAWIGIGVAAVALLVVAGTEQGGIETDAEQVQRLSESYACPVCSGESVAESNAAVAATIRQFISDEVTAGKSETEIRDELIQSYGVEVLLNPPAEGITTLVWVLPVMFVVLGAVGVAGAITRNRGVNREASAEDLALLDEARKGRP
ncbi:MAG: cytochrome c-type biogenesis protein [Acidimicrobiales bacterium]